MKEYQESPKYHLSIKFLFSFCLDALSGTSRSFQKDGVRIVAEMGVPMKIRGEGFILQNGPCLVVFNHYSREGFSILYAVAAIASAIPSEMHWLMTGAWTFPGRPFSNQLRKLSEWVFRRIAYVYGFTLTPPMPPEPQDEPLRVDAIRRVFLHIKSHPDPLVALAPEGRDFPGEVLGELPVGSGKFLLELDRRLGKTIPVGIFEEDGALNLHFGQPFELCSIIKPDSPDSGQEAANLVMSHLAALLPEKFAGKYNS
jgi:hypothetical protein